MTFGIHPIFLIAGVTLVGAVMCIVFAFQASQWLKRGIFIVIALVLFAPTGLILASLKPELVDARYRTYKRLYREIQVAMTRTEVMALISSHYPPGGKRLPQRSLLIRRKSWVCS